MNHIFYQTKTNYQNTGDSLINYALIETLREFGALHVNCGRDVPEWFLKTLGVLPEEQVISENEIDYIVSVLKCAKKCRKTGDQVYIFSGPGDMFGGGFRLVVRNLASGIIFPVFRLFGVNIVRIGRSVGPVTRMMAVSEWIRGLFLSHYYVRDSQWLDRCHRMGIKKTKQCPDMSWLYDRMHPKRINRTNVVMVNLRDRIFDDYVDSVSEATVKKCDDLLEKLHELLNGKMRLCIAYQTEEDAEYAKFLYDRYKDKYSVDFVSHRMSLSEFQTYYGAVDYHISNRMHSLLAGYKYGSLPIALIDKAHHVKIAATFEDCRLDDLLFDIFSDDLSEMDGIVENRVGFMNRLFALEQKNCEQIYVVLKKEIFDIAK